MYSYIVKLSGRRRITLLVEWLAHGPEVFSRGYRIERDSEADHRP